MINFLLGLRLNIGLKVMLNRIHHEMSNVNPNLNLTMQHSMIDILSDIMCSMSRLTWPLSKETLILNIGNTMFLMNPARVSIWKSRV